MADLSVSYMNLTLRNPIIAGSSSLTRTVEGVRRCEEAGAGAVVLKSLFEEQIMWDVHQAEKETSLLAHTEAYDYIRKTTHEMSQSNYLNLVKESRKAVSIPVIASLNCVTKDPWIDYASRLADAGADALELNIAIMPTYLMQTGKEVEGTYLKIVEDVRKKVSLPLAVKIGSNFSSLPHTAHALARAGADALVMFNRYSQFDIDVEKMSLKYGFRFGTPVDIHIPLRWIAVLATQAECDLVGSGGIYDGEAVVKHLLAGARAVQVCSVLFQKGLDRIKGMVEELESWMDRKGYKNIDDFRGKMSMELKGKPDYYQRLQYIKVYSGEDI